MLEFEFSEFSIFQHGAAGEWEAFAIAVLQRFCIKIRVAPPAACLFA
jgi:hypothetical protein